MNALDTPTPDAILTDTAHGEQDRTGQTGLPALISHRALQVSSKPSTDEPQDRLGELQAIILYEQVQARQADRRSLDHHRRIGEALTEAKELPALKGKFGVWAEKEFGFSKQWTSQLMYLAHESKEFEVARAWAESTHRAGGNEFTVDGAVALLKAFKAARAGQTPQPNAVTTPKNTRRKDQLVQEAPDIEALRPPATRSAAEELEEIVAGWAVRATLVNADLTDADGPVVLFAGKRVGSDILILDRASSDPDEVLQFARRRTR